MQNSQFNTLASNHQTTQSSISTFRNQPQVAASSASTITFDDRNSLLGNDTSPQTPSDTAKLVTESKNLDVNLTDTSSNTSCCDLDINNENNSDDNIQDIDANMSDANSYTIACSTTSNNSNSLSKRRGETKQSPGGEAKAFDLASTKQIKAFDMDTSISSIHSDKQATKMTTAPTNETKSGPIDAVSNEVNNISDKPPYIYKLNRNPSESNPTTNSDTTTTVATTTAQTWVRQIDQFKFCQCICIDIDNANSMHYIEKKLKIL